MGLLYQELIYEENDGGVEFKYDIFDIWGVFCFLIFLFIVMLWRGYITRTFVNATLYPQHSNFKKLIYVRCL
jgi:hypothetical protein